MSNGVLSGFPMQDIRVVLLGGSYHQTDSSEAAFEAASVIAVENAAQKASPVLLEPIMQIQVIAPSEHIGKVIGDLNSRRAQIHETGAVGTSEFIDAQVPLAQMFQYTTELRSLTQGRGMFTMEFSHHDIAPASIRDAVVNRPLF